MNPCSSYTEQNKKLRWEEHSSELGKSCLSCIFVARNSDPCNPTALSWQEEETTIIKSQGCDQLETQLDLWELSKIWYSPPFFLYYCYFFSCYSCRDPGLGLRSCGFLSYSINMTQPGTELTQKTSCMYQLFESNSFRGGQLWSWSELTTSSLFVSFIITNHQRRTALVDGDILWSVAGTDSCCTQSNMDKRHVDP